MFNITLYELSQKVIVSTLIKKFIDYVNDNHIHEDDDIQETLEPLRLLGLVSILPLKLRKVYCFNVLVI